MTVELYDAPTLGTNGYIQVFPFVQVNDSHFSLEIGPGLPDLARFHFLQITIGQEVLSPRQLLLLSPLALQAVNSHRISGMTTNEFISMVTAGMNTQSQAQFDSLTQAQDFLASEIITLVNTQVVLIGNVESLIQSVDILDEQNSLITSTINTLAGEIGSINTNLSQINTDLSQLQSDLGLAENNASSGISDLQTQITGLQTDVSVLLNVPGDISNLQSSLVTSQTDIANLLSGQSQLAGDVSSLHALLANPPIEALTSGAGVFWTSSHLVITDPGVAAQVHSHPSENTQSTKI